MHHQPIYTIKFGLVDELQKRISRIPRELNFNLVIDRSIFHCADFLRLDFTIETLAYKSVLDICTDETWTILN